jgi:hypothetical protein
MAAHGLLAVKTADPTAETSYIGLNNQLVSDAGHESEDLRRGIQLTFEELRLLHGYFRCEERCNGTPIPEVTERLAPLAAAGWQHLRKGKAMNGHAEARIRPATEASYPIYTDNHELAKALDGAFGKALWTAEADGLLWKATLTTNSSEFWDLHHYFAKSGWFEFKSLAALREAIGQQRKWSPDIVFAQHCSRSKRVEAENGERRTFEIDIAAVFGYQLILISCTSTRKDKTKEKAFEALHRARQLGGAGARAIVVSDEEDCVVKQYQESLDLDIGLTKEVRSKPLEVWGKGKLSHLSLSFTDYITRL